jgi:hypothetical protein
MYIAPPCAKGDASCASKSEEAAAEKAAKDERQRAAEPDSVRAMGVRHQEISVLNKRKPIKGTVKGWLRNTEFEVCVNADSTANPNPEAGVGKCPFLDGYTDPRRQKYRVVGGGDAGRPVADKRHVRQWSFAEEIGELRVRCLSLYHAFCRCTMGLP